MRRILGVLLGPVLVGAVLAVPPAHAVVAESSFEFGIVVGEGPAPTPGRQLTYGATLVSGSNPIPGVPVTLAAWPRGGTSFVPVGHGTTAADGTVSITVALRKTSVLRWEFGGTVDYEPSKSAGFTQEIGRRVPARVADSTVRGRQRVVVTGSALPLRPGLRVTLWRGTVPSMVVGTAPTRIAVGTIRSDGTFRLTARFAHPGAKKLYVRVAPGDGNAAGYSRYLRIQVR